MTTAISDRLRDAVAGTSLAASLPKNAAAFLERRANDEAARNIDDRVLLGLARLIATEAEMAGFLSYRPELFERIAAAGVETIDTIARGSPEPDFPDDLEVALDALRILRREETCLVACLDLGGVCRFEATSGALSRLAETIARRALALAHAAVTKPGAGDLVSVVGMGKIAGREFTYHSDLDLIFLFEGGPDQIADACRIGQRMVSGLTTMTGAGVAYSVDTRLRPSGEQGMLVTSFEGFDRYQCERAQTWEHLAMLRARAIAGNLERTQGVLDHARGEVLARKASPWDDLAPLRQRVVAERARESDARLSIKTGSGGLMDVDFLAGGGLLEKGCESFPVEPSVPAMLRTCAGGATTESILLDYRFLRLVESRTRWLAGGPVEALTTDEAELAAIAELVTSGLDPTGLLDRVAAARGRIRGHYEAVIGAGSIDALLSETPQT